MLIQRVNRSDPEKIFVVVYNSYATAAITVGQCVVWDYTTDADGVSVTEPSVALRSMIAGIVESTSIGAGGYGLIQVYGHNSNALVDGTTGIHVGAVLIPHTTTFNLTVMTTALDTFGAACSFPITCGQTYTTGAAAAKKVFLRCL